jgi:phosphatidate cytidylyltransferase
VIVAGADPANNRIASLLASACRSNLGLRIISSLVLAPLALATAYWGGIAFLAFWSAAALVVLWEWDTLVCAHDKYPVLILGMVALVGAALLLAFESPGTAVTLIVLGVLGITTLASKVRRLWCAVGLVYAGALQLAPVLLRADAAWGFAAMVFLFVVVWGTDIAAYFSGRALGGAKLMPQISPSKTWSGAAGGTAVGVIAGLVVAQLAGVTHLAAVGLVALVLSVASQAGDLLESAVKRRFNAKDASTLLPGHGGLMDRLDGFLVAVVVALVIGVARGGFAAPARGLMVW